MNIHKRDNEKETAKEEKKEKPAEKADNLWSSWKSSSLQESKKEEKPAEDLTNEMLKIYFNPHHKVINIKIEQPNKLELLYQMKEENIDNINAVLEAKLQEKVKAYKNNPNIEKTQKKAIIDDINLFPLKYIDKELLNYLIKRSIKLIKIQDKKAGSKEFKGLQAELFERGEGSRCTEKYSQIEERAAKTFTDILLEQHLIYRKSSEEGAGRDINATIKIKYWNPAKKPVIEQSLIQYVDWIETNGRPDPVFKYMVKRDNEILPDHTFEFTYSSMLNHVRSKDGLMKIEEENLYIENADKLMDQIIYNSDNIVDPKMKVKIRELKSRMKSI